VKLMVVLGEGGHTAELLRLVDLLGQSYEYHYVISKEDNLSAGRIREVGTIHRVIRPRGKSTGKLAAALRTIFAGLQALWILLRVRPAALISTGPAIVVPISIAAKLFRVRIIFVETGSRVRTLSLTGRIMYRWADLFFVQWPQLAEELPKAVYAGRLI